MIAFLWTLLFVIEVILFGITIASWQKGSVWSGLWWGIGGYVVLGIGAVFAYYFYVIEPAKTANPSPDIPPDRPWMELEVSAYGDISFDQNGNATFPIKFIANNS